MLIFDLWRLGCCWAFLSTVQRILLWWSVAFGATLWLAVRSSVKKPLLQLAGMLWLGELCRNPSIVYWLTQHSHVFCLDCANRLLLANGSNRIVCPACDQHLANEDDVARAKLHPSEDYKTSVLSGLNPNTIMECAGRAMNFWAYQTSQEM